MKTWNKILSIVLVQVMLVWMLSLLCSAATSDVGGIVQCTGWSTGKYYSPDTIYEIILHPRYIEQADVQVTDSYKNALEANTEYTVHRKDVEGYGMCYVLCVVKDRAAYLQPNSFLDKDGNGNEKLYLTNVEHLTNRRIVKLDSDFSAGTNVMEQGTATKITFETSGTVQFGGKTLAEDVNTYTLEYTDPGEYMLVLSVDGLTVAKYKICVKTAAQIREDRIAELEKDLSDTKKAFFKSLPLALITLPLAPLAIFGFLWPFAPIEIAGRYFDIVSELRNLKSQR